MAALQDYFEHILEILCGVPGYASLPQEPLLETILGTFGILTAVIDFQDGSRMRVWLSVDLIADTPDWRHYAFQYETSERRTIFRYDNSPHYPGLVFFPHHKHTDKAVSSCPRPSIRQIRDDIEEAIASGSDGPRN